jgi:hypothetical protein
VLGPKPGPRIRSGVSVPESVLQAARTRPLEDAEFSDEDLPEHPLETLIPKAAPKETMVDLDDW